MVAYYFRGRHMRCMIVLISRVKLRIIVQSGDCIRDCIMDPFYINDLGDISIKSICQRATLSDVEPRPSRVRFLWSV
jgi:hypothetical protein